MGDKKFIEFAGGHGASFFFPVGSFADWKKGLEFYRAVAASAKLKKALLKLAFPVLKRRARLSSAEVAKVVASELGLTELPSIDGHASAMISPTRDKALVHHHGRSFEKFASGGSLPGVRRELELYRRLAEWGARSFAFSRILDSSVGKSSVRFEMVYASGEFSDAPPKLSELIEPLAEFFALPGRTTRPWAELWNELAPGLELPAGYRDGETPVGLVHRDFKPWNVKSGEKPLFFDFESASFTGCPLEDLFNYIVEPMLQSGRAENVSSVVHGKYRGAAETLLDKLGIPRKEAERYWHWYLLERAAFWRTENRARHAELFIRIYENDRMA